MVSIIGFCRFSIYFLLIFLPFWDVIVPLFTRFSSSFFYIVGPVRYEIMIFFSLFFVASSIRYKSKVKILPLFFMLSYLSITILSLISSDAGFLLKVEAVKLQLIIVFYCFTLLLLSGSRVVLDISAIKKIFHYQLIIVVLVGFFEFFDQSILSLIYNKPREEIQHIQYFSSQRLISLIGNPINLGAFLLVCICFNLEKLTSKRISIKYWSLFSLSGFVIYMTLSRLSLIAYIFISILVFYRTNKVMFVISLVLGFLLFFLISPNVNFSGDSIERMISVLDMDTYEGNARVVNWNYALDKFKNAYDYLFGLGFGYSNPSKEYSEHYGSLIIENTFISIFIELGVIGFIMFLIIYLRFYYLSFNYYKIYKDFSFVAFLIIFSLFSIGNDFHRNMPFSFYFWFLYVWLEVKKCNVNRLT